MSDSSDVELPDNLAVAPAVPLAERLRKEVVALRAQVLDGASENSILKARMRDIDDIYARRLSEQVAQQIQAREAQVAEIDSIKRALGATEQKNVLLRSEIKTLEARVSRPKGGGGSVPGGPTRPNGLIQGTLGGIGASPAPLGTPAGPVGPGVGPTPSAPFSDGFQVKRRRFEPVQPAANFSFRGALASLKNKAGRPVLEELDRVPAAAVIGLASAEETAAYLAKLEPTRTTLSLLSLTLLYCRSPVDLSPVCDRLMGLLVKLEPLPSIEGDSLVMSKAAVDTLLTVYYTLDVLVDSGFAVPPVVVDNLLKTPLLAGRGLAILENQGMGDTAPLSDLQPPERCLELLFGSMWDPQALDDSVLGEYSKECYILKWKLEALEPLCRVRHEHARDDFLLQLARTLCVASMPEKQATQRIIGLLCSASTEEMMYQCVRFLWLNVTILALGPCDQQILVARVAQVAATSNKARSHALYLLGKLVTPNEYEQLKVVTGF